MTPPESSDPESLPLPFLAAEAAAGMAGEPLVVVARTPAEFLRWLEEATSAVQWIQVEGLLGEADAWSAAARGGDGVALDVVMSDPGSEYPLLYRLVDVSNARDLRVTIPLRPGFLKALRLAAAVHLPVRLLPVQPDRETLAELTEAVGFYLHDPVVEVPVEFFHSTLAWCRGVPAADLWTALEQDPAVFQHLDENATPVLPAERPGASAAGFVAEHLRQLVREGAECATCHWRDFCRGFFKLPDPDYPCRGIVAVLDLLQDAADQIGAELDAPPTPPPGGSSPAPAGP